MESFSNTYCVFCFGREYKDAHTDFDYTEKSMKRETFNSAIKKLERLHSKKKICNGRGSLDPSLVCKVKRSNKNGRAPCVEKLSK